VQKPRFYEAFDSQTRGEDSPQSLGTKHGVAKRTTYKWLKKRQTQGSPAYRKRRKLSIRFGRQLKLTNEQLQRLLSPSNHVRKQHYEHQIEHFGLSCGIRTLQGTNPYEESSFQIATERDERNMTRSIKRRPLMILGEHLLHR
jgi:hypothetical protein